MATYKGRYSPLNPQKYKGNPTNIIYRSGWERKFMVWCDNNPSILEWGSEETVIPYISPFDKKIHRYFVDFYIKVKKSDGKVACYLIEIKPKKYTVEPVRKPTRKTKQWYSDVQTWGINSAKWRAATEYAKDRNWQFMILTEDHLK